MLERDTKQKRVRQECARQMAEASLSKTKKQHSFVRPLGRARGSERAFLSRGTSTQTEQLRVANTPMLLAQCGPGYYCSNIANIIIEMSKIKRQFKNLFHQTISQ
ncbi:unnamed protein product [Arctia plantaginis]|uniref:Uncharacterized protein n=1 Tax=Arctia plantaginis TaxID=874455 RepID=A0A8S1AZ90_ARCPL|nr:unnamed protein product [Arctia plantaginis]